jgi:hypothetical protein
MSPGMRISQKSDMAAVPDGGGVTGKTQRSLRSRI